MIYFIAPDDTLASGGVRHIYRHVDTLVAHQVPATVVHTTRGFRCSWFPNTTPITYAPDVRDDPARDIVVIPEVNGFRSAFNIKKTPKVILNQNAYLTFRDHAVNDPVVTPYTHPEVVGAFCVSEDNRRYLSYAFPDLHLFRIRYGLDPALFHPNDPKQPVVAFMPRKNSDHALQVLNLLVLRGALRGFQLDGIHGRTESDAARALRASTIFLSFGFPEGCPFPPKEAMACGNVVVGYHGAGGRDYFLPDHSFPVEQGDIVAFAQTVERVLALHRTDRPAFDAVGRRASDYILSRYTPAQESADVLDAWRAIHAKLGRPFPA